MTIKFVGREATATIAELKTGDAFFLDGSYYIKSDEGGAEPASKDCCTRCMNVSDNPGYIGHMYNDAVVTPVTMTITPGG